MGNGVHRQWTTIPGGPGPAAGILWPDAPGLGEPTDFDSATCDQRGSCGGRTDAPYGGQAGTRRRDRENGHTDQRSTIGSKASICFQGHVGLYALVVACPPVLGDMRVTDMYVVVDTVSWQRTTSANAGKVTDTIRPPIHDWSARARSETDPARANLPIYRPFVL